MSFNNTIKMAMLGVMMGAATTASAAKEGVTFLYGLGVGGFMSDEQIAGVDAFDPAATASAFLGIEEKGWALEYTVGKSLDSATANPTVDYSITAAITTLGYRTIEKNKSYYLIKFGKADVDLDLKGGNLPGYTDGETFEGNVYSIGMGWRMGKEERLELDYSFYKSDDTDNAHLLTARYIWGGTPASDK
ncbi:MAG: hypothetical protein EP315_09065 [Gammaproteobacteria bacterium]|nr:MAG: hypothetical protein EP315_09065 [Gammaproteobacteria bacterium]